MQSKKRPYEVTVRIGNVYRALLRRLKQCQSINDALEVQIRGNERTIKNLEERIQIQKELIDTNKDNYAKEINDDVVFFFLRSNIKDLPDIPEIEVQKLINNSKLDYNYESRINQIKQRTKHDITKLFDQQFNSKLQFQLKSYLASQMQGMQLLKLKEEGQKLQQEHELKEDSIFIAKALQIRKEIKQLKAQIYQESQRITKINFDIQEQQRELKFVKKDVQQVIKLQQLRDRLKVKCEAITQQFKYYYSMFDGDCTKVGNFSINLQWLCELILDKDNTNADPIIKKFIQDKFQALLNIKDRCTRHCTIKK